MSFELILFYSLASVAVASSVALVGFARRLVTALVCLLTMMLSLGGIYLLLGAPLVAAVQVFVHTAGMAVLFWVAISRLGLESGFTTRTLSEGAIKVVACGGVLSIAIWFAIRIVKNSPFSAETYAAASGVREAGAGVGAGVSESGAALGWPVEAAVIALSIGLIGGTAMVALGRLTGRRSG